MSKENKIFSMSKANTVLSLTVYQRFHQGEE